mgnify:CR=1 FL=1
MNWYNEKLVLFFYINPLQYHCMKKKFYNDDSQVKTLLIGKKMENRVRQNFAYIAIKELKDGRDVDAIKISGLERSITLFQELKSKGLI